ncbi:MAG: hypothetical protein ACP5NV_02205 [Candidatus Woesearchaeota archaeon]
MILTEELVRKTVEEVASLVEEVKHPKKGAFIVWYNRSIPGHVGIINNTDSLSFANRRSSKGDFHKEDTIEDLKKHYSREFPRFNLNSSEIKYFIPSKFQKIIDEEMNK